MVFKRIQRSEIISKGKQHNPSDGLTSRARKKRRPLVRIFGYIVLTVYSVMILRLFMFEESTPDGNFNVLSANELEWGLRQNNNRGVISSLSLSSSQNQGNKNGPTSSSTEMQTRHHEQKQQRICFLAGPHKSGSSSIQTNLWRWTIPVSTYEFVDPRFPPLGRRQYEKPAVNWIWPAPSFIVENMTGRERWQPGKSFYPLLVALTNPNENGEPRQVPFHTKSYSSTIVLEEYRQEIQKYWDRGHNIVFGTEAMDRVTVRGSGLIENFTKEVLPKNMKGSQMTVVVTYRTPKIDQLVSTWREQNDMYEEDEAPSFYDWIVQLDERVTFKHLNALGMVDMFLENTDWDIALIDLQGLKEEGWDSPSFVACEILGEECEDRGLVELKHRRTLGADKNATEPVVMNVRNHDEPPNMSRDALYEMDEVLTGADCHNLHRFLKYHDRRRLPNKDGDSNNDRLRIYFPAGMKKLMRRCKFLPKDYIADSKGNMIKNLISIARSYGKDDA